MPDISGFHATHFAPALDLEKVTAPPYDVISPDERDRLEALDPHNIVHLTLGRQDENDSETDNRYTRAAASLAQWRAAGVLTTDDDAHLFLYRLDFVDEGRHHTIAGIVAALTLEELGAGAVFGHERTIAGPKADRLNLMRATGANLEPLWFFASRTMSGFGEIVEEVSAGTPMADVTDPAGIRHRVWSLPAGHGATVREVLEDIPLVVADGHHRYETSLTYRDERRATGGPGPWDATLAMITDPVAYAPAVHAIHRLVKELPASRVPGTVPFDGTFDELAGHVFEAGAGTLGVASTEGLWTLSSPADIDTVWLAETILEPSGKPVRYEHDLKIVAERMAFKSETAFIMAPTPVDRVASEALKGVRLPPKTTLFTPKPRSGLLLRTF